MLGGEVSFSVNLFDSYYDNLDMNIYGGDNFLNDINLFGGYSSMMDEIDINESCFGILIY